MDDDLMRMVTVFSIRLVSLAANDEGLRADLRALAGAFLVATESPPLVLAPETVGNVVEVEAQEQPGLDTLPDVEELPIVKEASPTPISFDTTLPELTLGRTRLPEAQIRFDPLTTTKVATADTELPGIESRCRLKAEGVRWASTRRRRLDEGAEFRFDIAPRDKEILDRAGHLNCYLWMNTPDFAIPRESAPLEELAGCFEAVADALELIRGMLPEIEANREFFEPALDLLAEAQSALRLAVERIDGRGDDDQYRAYDWLRGVATRERHYIRRHMRLDDPADPATLPEIEGRIEALDTRFEDVRGRAKRRKSALNRLRYHAKRINDGQGVEHDWRKVAGAIDEMIGDGERASSVQIREILLPILDALPDLEEFPPGFALALREIDYYLAGRTPAREGSIVEAPTPEVVESARLLKDKCVVLIGGSRRSEAYESLKAALGLQQLIWIETREHESIEKFEPYVTRPEVALVLLAIRWSSHSFGDVKRFCDRYDKPMVRLPGGYGVNQVAAQIIAQCSGRLGE